MHREPCCLVELPRTELPLRDQLLRHLEEAAQPMLTHAGMDAETVLGAIDALKLRSSMTLFSGVPEASPVFAQVLDTFYGGMPCPLTQSLLEQT